EKGRAYLHKTFNRLGITLREKITVKQIAANAAVTQDGSMLPFDLCLWTAGFSIPLLARQSGIRVNACGQVLIDGELRSVSHPNIYAVGDAAAFETPLRLACATAMPMGAHAAD